MIRIPTRVDNSQTNEPEENPNREFFSARGVNFDPLTPTERERVDKHWLSTYAAKVKEDTGEWIYNRFRWHGFSYELQTAVAGPPALMAYQEEWQAPYVIFDEEGVWAYSCVSQEYPDFTPLDADIYVAHHNMKWTMVFTHEQPDIGPYFALKTDHLD